MELKFYIPKNEYIPTELRLCADDIHVFYHRVPDKFAYDFDVYCDDSIKATAIAKEIANILCVQSYDHGSEWRVVSVKEVNQDAIYDICRTIRVEFRVKDIY